MGEREERRARSARQAKVMAEKVVPIVAALPMWECAGCRVRVPRGEACSKCHKSLLEG